MDKGSDNELMERIKNIEDQIFGCKWIAILALVIAGLLVYFK